MSSSRQNCRLQGIEKAEGARKRSRRRWTSKSAAAIDWVRRAEEGSAEVLLGKDYQLLVLDGR